MGSRITSFEKGRLRHSACFFGWGMAPAWDGWWDNGKALIQMRHLSERGHGRHTRTSGESTSSIVWAAGLEWERLYPKTHLTTTIEKSGGGGAVLRYGVFGLWRW